MNLIEVVYKIIRKYYDVWRIRSGIRVKIRASILSLCTNLNTIIKKSYNFCTIIIQSFSTSFNRGFENHTFLVNLKEEEHD